VDARAGDGFERADRAGEFAFGGAGLVHLLAAGGEAERAGAVEHVVADLAADLLARHAHAQLRELFGWRHDRGAVA
jgi:hypothetical protein